MILKSGPKLPPHKKYNLNLNKKNETEILYKQIQDLQKKKKKQQNHYTPKSLWLIKSWRIQKQ